MTTTPPDEPQVPGDGPTDPPTGQPYGGPTPPPPGYAGAPTPPPPGYGSTPPAGGYAAAPPPGGYGAPPPAGGYGAPPVGGYVPNAAPPLSDSEQRTWAMLSHLGGILFGFIPPLIVWAVYKGRGAFVEDQAKEALNFQILITIAYIVGSVLLFVVVGALILAAAWIAAVIFGIMGGMAANRGELYRYPFNWRIVK